MNNLSQFVILKMGGKCVFKEPLQSMRSFGNNSFTNNMNSNNSYYSPINNNYNTSSINNNNQKRNYENFDIIPKFLSVKTKEESNVLSLDKLIHKKQTFKNLISSFFNETEENFKNEIEEAEMEIDRQNDIFENIKNGRIKSAQVVI